MSNELTEGFWPCTVLSASTGQDPIKRNVIARINVKITDGPDKGKLCTYEDEINMKSALYVGRSCRAVGLQGADMTKLADHCAAWIAKTGGASTVEIKHIPYTDKKTGEPKIWTKPNSIGRGPKPLVEPSGESLADANEAMRRAMEADGVAVGGSDEPHAGGEVNDDLPFATISRVSLGEIAACLRGAL